jgi:1-acyl-sn-glycerol-3-phosphate acyltransferase
MIVRPRSQRNEYLRVSRLHRPRAGFWIRFCVVVLYPLDSLLYRIRFHHLERVPPPEAGGVIIAINHISQIDTVLMARLVWQAGRIPRFMIKASLFRKPVIGRVFRGAGQIPVYRGTTTAATSLDDAVRALQRGEAIVIYPEGTTTRDPQLWPMEAKTGIARLVLLAPHIPVVPVGQWGAQKGQRFTPTRLIRRRRCEASVGESLDLSRYAGAEPSAAALREITDLIMTAVRDEVAELRRETPPKTFSKTAPVRVDKLA